MNPDDLERLIAVQLRDLPAPRAPGTLLPRVMDAVAARERSWHARAWRTWPVAWKVASGAVLLALAGVIGTLAPAIDVSVETLPGQWVTPEAASRLTAASNGLHGLWLAFEGVWRVMRPAVVALAALSWLMCAACVAVAVALNRVAFGGAVRL